MLRVFASFYCNGEVDHVGGRLVRQQMIHVSSAVEHSQHVRFLCTQEAHR